MRLKRLPISSPPWPPDRPRFQSTHRPVSTTLFEQVMTEADGATAPGLGTFENGPAIRLAATGSAGRTCGGQDQGAMQLGPGQGIPLAIGSQSHGPPIHYVRVSEATRCQLKQGCGRRHVRRQARKSPKRHHPPSRRPCEQWPRRGRSVITTPPANNSCASRPMSRPISGCDPATGSASGGGSCASEQSRRGHARPAMERDLVRWSITGVASIESPEVVRQPSQHDRERGAARAGHPVRFCGTGSVIGPPIGIALASDPIGDHRGAIPMSA